MLADVTFVDDARFLSKLITRCLLWKKTSALLQIVDEICEAHELLINMNDGKTEFSIERKGDGARQQFKRGTAHCIFHEDV